MIFFNRISQNCKGKIVKGFFKGRKSFEIFEGPHQCEYIRDHAQIKDEQRARRGHKQRK